MCIGVSVLEDLPNDRDDVNVDSDLNLQKLWSEQSLSTCLEGFLLVADSDDTILYISEGVSATLGLTQVNFVFLSCN